MVQHTAVTRIWLPEQLAALGKDGLPDGMAADVWTGGEPLPASQDEVEVIVMPHDLPSNVPPDVIAKIAKLPRLRYVQTLSAGTDTLASAFPASVVLCNGRGAHDASTSEWVLMAIVAQLRGLPGFVRAQQRETWERKFCPTVAGRHVLIVGYGSIGAAVERRLAGWEVTVERIARRARPETADSPRVQGMDALAGAMSRADVVVLVVPLTDETRGLVDARFLARMKDGALLINAARGAVVDTDALLSELNSGRLTAALDVADPEPLPSGHPLWKAPGVLITPHVGGAVAGAIDRAGVVVRAQLARYAAGQPLENVIGSSGY